MCFTTLSFMRIIAASRSISGGCTSWEHWWNVHHLMKLAQLFSTSQFCAQPPTVWEACHKELWNHQTNYWSKWKPRNDVWDRGRPTVEFGPVNYVIYIPSQFHICHDLVFSQFTDGMFRWNRQLRWKCSDFLHGLHRPWLP